MQQRCYRLPRALILGACLLLLSAVSVAGEAPYAVLKLCITGEPHPPFSDPVVETPIQQRIRTAAAIQGYGVQFLILPWLRCVHEALHGRMHGAVGLGADAAAMAGMRLPLKDGKPDPRRALSYMPFVFLRRAGDTVDWDGQQYHNLTGPVLVIGLVEQIKFDLQQTGVAFEDSAHGPYELVRMLLAGRGNLAVDSLGRVNKIITEPEFAGRIEVLAKPLGGSLGMLVIAPHLYEQNPQRIETLWDDYARLREEQEGAQAR